MHLLSCCNVRAQRIIGPEHMCGVAQGLLAGCAGESERGSQTRHVHTAGTPPFALGPRRQADTTVGGHLCIATVGQRQACLLGEASALDIFGVKGNNRVGGVKTDVRQGCTRRKRNNTGLKPARCLMGYDDEDWGGLTREDARSRNYSRKGVKVVRRGRTTMRAERARQTNEAEQHMLAGVCRY